MPLFEAIHADGAFDGADKRRASRPRCNLPGPSSARVARPRATRTRRRGGAVSKCADVTTRLDELEPRTPAARRRRVRRSPRAPGARTPAQARAGPHACAQKAARTKLPPWRSRRGAARTRLPPWRSRRGVARTKLSPCTYLQSAVDHSLRLQPWLEPAPTIALRALTSTLRLGGGRSVLWILRAGAGCCGGERGALPAALPSARDHHRVRDRTWAEIT